ncbi:flavin reductase family protein [Niveibacterium terrae]|uniref:flavin reductase family protein n=1 Tax=Niveibacterium terrae TaxID=3373598 RepID=UPI003A8E38F5
MFSPVAQEKAYRLLNHGPVTLISSAANGARNVMAAAWAMPLDFSPARVAVVVDKASYTRELIEASGSFIINIPCARIAKSVLAVGSVSGRELDKFAHFAIKTLPAEKLEAPRIAGCVGWLECMLIREEHTQQAYDLLIGEVVAASADPRVFRDGHWEFGDDASLATLHYVAGGQFFVTGESLFVEAQTE